MNRVKQMKKSKVNLMCAIFWAAAVWAWLPGLPGLPEGSVNWPRIVFPILCAAACVWQLIQCFKSRRAESEETV